jgi:hypothetical protein
MQNSSRRSREHFIAGRLNKWYASIGVQRNIKMSGFFSLLKKETILLTLFSASAGFGAAWISGISNAHYQKSFTKVGQINYGITSSTSILDSRTYGVKKLVLDGVEVKNIYSSTIQIQNNSDDSLKNIDMCFFFNGKPDKFQIISSSYNMSGQFPENAVLNSEKDLKDCDIRQRLPLLGVKEMFSYTILTNEPAQLGFKSLSGENSSLFPAEGSSNATSNWRTFFADYQVSPFSFLLFSILTGSSIIALLNHKTVKDGVSEIAKNNALKNEISYILGANNFLQEASHLRSLERRISPGDISDNLVETWLMGDDKEVLRRGAQCITDVISSVGLSNYDKAVMSYDLARIFIALTDFNQARMHVKKALEIHKSVIERRLSIDKKTAHIWEDA